MPIPFIPVLFGAAIGAAGLRAVSSNAGDNNDIVINAAAPLPQNTITMDVRRAALLGGTALAVIVLAPTVKRRLGG